MDTSPRLSPETWSNVVVTPRHARMTQYKLMVMCIERKMKMQNNTKMVCNDLVREICETLKHPTLPFLTDVTETVLHCKDIHMYLAQYISPLEHVLQFQIYFCTCCGNYIVHERMAIEDNRKMFECRC
jgi:hypothetical protein